MPKKSTQKLGVSQRPKPSSNPFQVIDRARSQAHKQDPYRIRKNRKAI